MVSKCCPTHEELLAYSLGRVSLGGQAALSEHVRDVLLNLMQMELHEQMSLSKRTQELVIS